MKKGLLVGVSLLTGLAEGIIAMGIVTRNTARSTNKEVDKFKKYYEILCQWMAHKQRGRSLEEYFMQNGYHSIAIYGMGGLGSRLYEDLKNSGIDIKYAIDQDVSCIYPDLKTISPKDKIEKVDVIVVTAVFAFDEIKEMLSQKTKSPVISLEEVLYEL